MNANKMIGYLKLCRFDCMRITVKISFFMAIFLSVFKSFAQNNLIPPCPGMNETFIVTNTDDYYGDPNANPVNDPLTIEGSFRWAMTMANQCDPGPDSPHQIHFNIPGNGVHTILAQRNFPKLRSSVIIDGLTQPGAEPCSPTIEIDGSQAIMDPADPDRGKCFEFNYAGDAGGSGSDIVLLGLIINYFPSYEGQPTAAVHVNSGNGRLTVKSCFIGTEPDGITAAPNRHGIYLNTFSADDINGEHTIGGPGCERNIISGNSENGIVLFNTRDNLIENNLVGVDKNGNPLGNGEIGIFVASEANAYDCVFRDNNVSHNGGVGIANCCGSVRNVFHNNLIEHNGSHGMTFLNDICMNNVVGVNSAGEGEPNIIRYNGGEGVLVSEWEGNPGQAPAGGGASWKVTIRENSIYCNGQDNQFEGAAINHHNPLNPALEAGNEAYPAPVIDVAASNQNAITGTCADPGSIIDVYEMSGCATCTAGSEEQGDALRYLGETTCNGGNWTFTAADAGVNNLANNLAATATESATPWANTSEFSTCIDLPDECIFPPIATIDGPTEICANEITLLGNEPLGGQTGTWTVNPTGNVTINAPNNPTTTVNFSDGGIYTFTWTVVDDAGLCPQASVDHRVEITLTPDIDAGPDVTICSEPGVATLNAAPLNGLGIGTWTIAPGTNDLIDSPNSNSTDVGPLALPGPYTFTWTVQISGCPDLTDDVIVNIDPATGGVQIDGGDLIVCNDGELPTLFTANASGGTWDWVGGDKQPFPVSNPPATDGQFPETIDDLSIQGWSGGASSMISYTAPAQGACPGGADTITITVSEDPPVVNITDNVDICAGTAEFEASPGGGTWGQNSGPNLTFTPSDVSLNFTNLAPGTYNLTYTIDACSGGPVSESVEFTISSPPDSAIAGPSQEICISDLGAGVNMNATAVTAPSEGTWTTTSAGVNFGDDNSPTTTVTGLTIGEHLFTWTVGVPPSNTCGTSVDTMMIIIDAAPTDFPDLDTALCDVNLDIDLGTLNTGIGETGTWSITAGGGTLTPNDNPQTTVTGATIGMNTYVFTTSVPGSVCPADEATVNFEVLGQGGPANILEEDTLEICILSDTTLNAEDPSAYGTGIWSVVGTLTGAGDHINNLTGTSLGEGVTQVNWTVTYNTGCDPQTDSVWILVSPEPDVPEAGEDVDLCSTAGSYQLSGNNLGNEGYWETSGNGTFDDNTLFNATYTFGTSDTLSDQNVITLYWNSQGGGCPSLVDSMTITIDKTPIVEAGNDTLLCITQQPYTMTSLDNVYGTGVWTTTSTSANITDDGLYNTTVDGMAPGDHDFTWTVTNGECSGQDNVTISVEDTVTPANIPLDSLEICLAGGGEIRLPGNDPSSGTGLWTTVPVTTGGTIDDPSLYNSLVLNLADGNIMTAVWTISSATGVCPPSDDTIIVTVVDRVSPFVRLDAAPQDICLGDEVVFTATGINGGDAPVYTFFYADGTQIQQGPGNTLTLSPTQDTTVYVTMLSNSPCVDPSDVLATSDSVTIQVDTPPSPAVAGDDETVCTDSYTMQGVAPVEGSGVWSIASVTPAGSVVGVTPVTDANGVLATLVSGMEVTLYWTTSSDLGVCPADTDSVTITRVQDITIPDAGPDAVICAGSTHPLNANSVGAGETGEWTSSGTGTFGNVNDPNTVYTPSGADTTNGEVYLTWTISNGLCDPLSDSLRLQIDLNPTPADAGDDQIICSIGTRLGGNEPIVGSGIWTTTTSGVSIIDDTLYNTQVNDLPSPDITRFTWTISNGVCDPSSDVVAIDVRGQIKFPLLSGPSAICEDESINISVDPSTLPDAGNGERGVWTMTGTNNFLGSGADTSELSTETYTVSGADITAGSVWFTYTVSNTVTAECLPVKDSIEVEIDRIPSDAIATGADSCAGPDIQLTAVEPTIGSGQWTVVSSNTYSGNPPTFEDDTLYNTLVNFPAPYDSSANAVLRWTVSTGGVCEDKSVEVPVSIIGTQAPQISVINDSPVCEDSNVTVTVNLNLVDNAAGYVWTVNGDPLPAADDLMSYTGVFNDGDIVRVVMTSGLSCSSVNGDEDQTIIEVHSPTAIDLERDYLLCYPETGLLEVSELQAGTGSDYGYTWYEIADGGQPISVATVVDSYVANENSRSGTFDYYVVASDALGICPDVYSDTVRVEVLPDLFIRNISASPEDVYTDDLVSYNSELSTTDNITYYWYLGSDTLGNLPSGEFVPQDYPSIAGADQADVWLVVENENGCTDTARVQINIFQPIRIPNVFTPNGDEVNDIWKITGITNYDGAELRVYNRWGNKVYKYTHTKGKDFQFWNGKNDRDGQLPIGTYYFELDKKRKIRDDEPIKISGDVTLLR